MTKNDKSFKLRFLEYNDNFGRLLMFVFVISLIAGYDKPIIQILNVIFGIWIIIKVTYLLSRRYRDRKVKQAD